MNTRTFVIADVFTDTRFGGNQLAVFTDAEGLDALTMQTLAREINYSETTFLFPAEAEGDFRIRIFTPEHELPFAGHPIVGSGFVVAANRVGSRDGAPAIVVLETGVGPIRVVVDQSSQRAGRATMDQPLPQFVSEFGDLRRLAAALALSEQDLDAGTPAEVLSNGVPTLIVPVSSLSAVQSIRPNLTELDEISRQEGVETVLAFSTDTVHPISTVHCRVFAPAAGLVEDAATGSANGPLGFYLVRHSLVPPAAAHRLISEQGYEMNRPSTLFIEIDSNLDEGRISGVRVGGGVVIAGRGEIFLD